MKLTGSPLISQNKFKVRLVESIQRSESELNQSENFKDFVGIKKILREIASHEELYLFEKPINSNDIRRKNKHFISYDK